MAEDAAGAVRRTPRLGIDNDADRWRDANGRANARIAELATERDLVVWLHAEAQHRLAEEQAASYNMYARVFQALGVSITEPWHGLAEAAQKVVAERDALSLLLRAMARKLVGYRRWTLGDDVPAVHRIRRERDALQARIEELTQMWQAEQQTAITMRGAYAKAIRERDALRPPGLTYPAGHVVVEYGEPAPGEPWPDCRHGRPQSECTECPGLTPPTGGAR